MVHRRLMAEGKGEQAEKALSIQECVFDEMWNDTSNRIRAAGINELSVYTYSIAFFLYNTTTYTKHLHSLTHMPI